MECETLTVHGLNLRIGYGGESRMPIHIVEDPHRDEQVWEPLEGLGKYRRVNHALNNETGTPFLGLT